MKGLVFSELMDMVEAEHGLAVLQDVLDQAQPSSGGAYSAVGNYDHQELVSILGVLSRKVHQPLPDLLRRFGEVLFGRFVIKYPDFFVAPQNTFEFLSTVDRTVHLEVRKLYEKAELPHFDYEYPAPDHMVVVYRSCRPLADLAEGLILGCAKHYRESIDIERFDIPDETQSHSRFHIKRRSPQ